MCDSHSLFCFVLFLFFFVFFCFFFFVFFFLGGGWVVRVDIGSSKMNTGGVDF